MTLPVESENKYSEILNRTSSTSDLTVALSIKDLELISHNTSRKRIEDLWPIGSVIIIKEKRIDPLDLL